MKINDENSRIRIQDPDPDPLARGMDPRFRIHPKMSWIRNTDFLYVKISSERDRGFLRPVELSRDLPDLVHPSLPHRPLKGNEARDPFLVIGSTLTLPHQSFGQSGIQREERLRARVRKCYLPDLLHPSLPHRPLKGNEKTSPLPYNWLHPHSPLICYLENLRKKD